MLVPEELFMSFRVLRARLDKVFLQQLTSRGSALSAEELATVGAITRVVWDEMQQMPGMSSQVGTQSVQLIQAETCMNRDSNRQAHKHEQILRQHTVYTGRQTNIRSPGTQCLYLVLCSCENLAAGARSKTMDLQCSSGAGACIVLYGALSCVLCAGHRTMASRTSTQRNKW